MLLTVMQSFVCFVLCNVICFVMPLVFGAPDFRIHVPVHQQIIDLVGCYMIDSSQENATQSCHVLNAVAGKPVAQVAPKHKSVRELPIT